jgi:hypothetical protein
MNAAETRASRAIALCTALTVVSRSLTTAEIDTFISDVSTTSTNIAAANRSDNRVLPASSCGTLMAASPVTDATARDRASGHTHPWNSALSVDPCDRGRGPPAGVSSLTHALTALPLSPVLPWPAMPTDNTPAWSAHHPLRVTTFPRWSSSVGMISADRSGHQAGYMSTAGVPTSPLSFGFCSQQLGRLTRQPHKHGDARIIAPRVEAVDDRGLCRWMRISVSR